MAEVKAPREFKFVGAYSRKRRRRNGPINSIEPISFPIVAAIPQPQPAAAPATPTSSPGNSDREDVPKAKPADRMPLAATRSPETRATLAETASNYQEFANSINGEALLHASNDEMSQDNGTTWSSTSLMNPFLDPGPSFLASFDQSNGHHQLPIFFGYDIPPIQLEDTSSTDSSPQDNFIGPTLPNKGDRTTVDSSTTDEIILPSLSSQENPCNISVTITQLLTRYDQEYCILPLTHDFDANPFRSDDDTGRNSQLLLHCILALSYRHISRDTGSYTSEAKIHKKKALQMLREMESASQSSPLEATFLEAVLILITLDCATSAYGPWTWHLKRAHKMIQATNSLNVKKTPRMQARIEILVWWDVTLALTSRQGCVLSESTMISLFNHDRDDNEIFYSISGCPEALFRHMIRLGSYAREFEMVANMTCAKFDMEPVLKVEKEILEWSDPEYGDFSDQYLSGSSSMQDYDIEDTAQHKADVHHCAEAWRWGLLTYISRIFKWQRDKAPPPILEFLARKTLNHVSACRATSMLQKQLLLPVFLAGCETTNEVLQQVARTYCNWWGERTRYDMFLTANALLEEVWSNDNPQAWWGSIIDQKSRSNAGKGEARQYLFG